MINYESTPKKIRKIWNQTIQNEDNADNLESGLVRNLSFDYNKNINKYIIYSGTVSNSDPIIYKITLKDFQSRLIPNIKISLESTSSSSVIDYYLLEEKIEDEIGKKIDCKIYIFYQGAATITIDLYIINPQDHR